jgi:hypothetical protein
VAKSRVTLNHAGARELLNDPGVRAFLADVADRVAAEAIRTAPVATGNYRDSIHRESVTTDRAVERVVASAPHAHLVEAKSGNLARALNAAGG